MTNNAEMRNGTPIGGFTEPKFRVKTAGGAFIQWDYTKIKRRRDTKTGALYRVVTTSYHVKPSFAAEAERLLIEARRQCPRGTNPEIVPA